MTYPETPTTTPPDAVATATASASVASASASSPSSPGPRRTSSKVVSTLAICAGAVLILGTVVTGGVSILRAASVHTGEVTASVAGVRTLDLDASAAQVTVSFGAVSEATLRVSGGSGADDWTLGRNGDRLVVASDRDIWARWGWLREPETVELVLPASAAGLDADLDLDSGSLRAEGDFGDLAVTLDAGSLRVTGTASDLTSEINAGSARFDLDGVVDARFAISAGSVDGALTGPTPSSIVVDVSAGRLDLAVPEGAYALTSDVSAGGFRHDLTVDPTSPHRVDVTVSAGSVVLRPAD
ncbi:MAG: hypothetical protein P0Y48_09140 [Candidatus Microbacterium phytovorans]|uniref:Adhesin domain-containing protein n=1 Tax=Candidatus Microbacterium phytovorans TaxID=3121374 RepID=A0AAJ6B335_9MICO|nr:hypothetical protein [Microbacterium sp.]WEK12637.1 MAG: hypothetical protein P0Y48_09140 [Microbacterium sp.]